MKKLLITFVLFTITISINSQNQKFRPLLWTTHDTNVDIAGLAFGLSQGTFTRNNNNSLIRVYGIRLEVNPFSFLHFLVPGTPISRSKEAYIKTMAAKVDKKTYGFNISTGSFQDQDTYGISLTGFMHYSRKNNGISIAGMTNSIERANGIVIGFGGNQIRKGNGLMISSAWGNFADHFNGIQISMENHIVGKGTGIQIGIFNKATNFKGIQLGLWNKNDKRSLPIINWNFKKTSQIQ